MTPAAKKESDVVYRRTPVSTDSTVTVAPSSEPPSRGIAPTVTPIVIAFLLLLGLISGLGLLSAKLIDQVSFNAKDLVTQNSAHQSVLLNLRLAVTKLDNEARTQSEAQSRRELKPPFDMRLNTAREEVSTRLEPLEKPPLSEDASWQQLRTDVDAFMEITKEARRYGLDGFGKSLDINNDMNAISGVLEQQREEIFGKVQDMQRQARRSIRLWSVIALLVGVLIAAGTVWEVQRRFKQMRRSTFEARRERIFTNQLLEGMVSAVSAIDEDDKIRSANAAFFKIFPRASIGASVLENLGADDAMKMLAVATVHKLTKRPTVVVGLRKLKVKEKTFDVYSSPLAINGTSGQIVTLVDATEVAESEPHFAQE
jgi:hypothetical protein